jgi:NADH-quinone oxidoreductase subunit L
MISTLAPLTIALPWLGALLVWLAGNGRPRLQHTIAVTGALLAAAAALLMLPIAHYSTDEPVFMIRFGGFAGDLTLLADGLSVLLAVIAAGIGSLTVIFSVDYMRGEKQLGRYYALVLLFIGAMCGLVLSGNLFFLFLFWEMTAFCSYALISFYNDDPKAVAAGLKALVITQIGGVGLLVGVLVAGAYLPDLQISTLLSSAGEIPSAALSVLAYGFLLAAVAKSAQVPLYMWLPDAMEAPTPVSALIHAATMVNAGVYLLARFYPSLADVGGWALTVILIGVVTALFGALRATVTNDLKRTLAYSTVSQLGYMVAAVGMGALLESQFHLFNHALFKALLFLGAGAIIHAVGTRDMRLMGGVWKQMPWTSAAFLVGAAALVGIPFLNGFWSKELLLEAAVTRDYLWVYVALVFGAGVTAFYSARMCWLVFFAPARQGTPAAEPATSGTHGPQPFMAAALIPLVAGTLLSWIAAPRLAGWFTATLPYHTLYLPHGEHAAGLISWALVLAPATLAALAAVAAGIGLWVWRVRHPGTGNRLGSAIERLDAWFNRVVARTGEVTVRAAAVVQRGQTGQLAWNVAAIIAALALLLIALIGRM